MASAKHNYPKAAFGKAVRKCRIAAGMTQEELAARAGIHRNYAGGVERGERNVALVNMVRLAQALGVRLSELVADVDMKEL